MDNPILNLLERILAIPVVSAEKEDISPSMPGFNYMIRVYGWPGKLLLAKCVLRRSQRGTLWIAGKGEHEVDEGEVLAILDAHEKRRNASRERVAAEWIEGRLDEAPEGPIHMPS